MAKTFYTEHDIEDLFRRGVMTLEVGDSVVLTDLAYEKARRLGMNLSHEDSEKPPAAPVRPYIARSQAPPKTPQFSGSASSFDACPPVVAKPKPDSADLQQRIRDAVAARLGTQVDPKLLDVIIQRVLNSAGIR
ncbi:MAG: hypothetical protein IT308_03730 [Anaerolineaceae bacterium]|nr:hypothetical protein [Anaerolineaceae bacterium]